LDAVAADRGLFRRIAGLKRFELAQGELCGAPVCVARTGYTGERWGVEILTHPEAAPALWRALLEAGAPLGLVPAGLGARDSTRTEAGLPLHGHELAGPHGVNPIEAGYGNFVKLHKPFFVGRAAMLAAVGKKARRIVRFAVTQESGQRPIRPGHVVVESRRGRVVGTVTSAVVLDEREVGMAIVDAAYARVNTRLAVYVNTDRDGALPAKRMSELSGSDWLPVSRPAKVLPRFPGTEHRDTTCEPCEL
jgi:glycine hydroxymethyltransferase